MPPKPALASIEDMEPTMLRRTMTITPSHPPPHPIALPLRAALLLPVRRGYTSIDPGRMPFEEQVVTFMRATHIAGPEGGAFINALLGVNVKHAVLIASPMTRGETFFPNIFANTLTELTTLYGTPVEGRADRSVD